MNYSRKLVKTYIERQKNKLQHMKLSGRSKLQMYQLAKDLRQMADQLDQLRKTK